VPKHFDLVLCRLLMLHLAPSQNLKALAALERLQPKVLLLSTFVSPGGWDQVHWTCLIDICWKYRLDRVCICALSGSGY
jgi:hypothetical protein